MVLNSTNQYIPDEEAEDIDGYIMLIGRVLNGVSADYWRGPCGRIWLGILERSYFDFNGRVPKDGYLKHCPDSTHNRVNDKEDVERPSVNNGYKPSESCKLKD